MFLLCPRFLLNGKARAVPIVTGRNVGTSDWVVANYCCGKVCGSRTRVIDHLSPTLLPRKVLPPQYVDSINPNVMTVGRIKLLIADLLNRDSESRHSFPRRGPPTFARTTAGQVLAYYMEFGLRVNWRRGRMGHRKTVQESEREIRTTEGRCPIQSSRFKK